MNRLVTDMAKKIAEGLQENLQREVNLARAVMDATELTSMMMLVAAGVESATISIALQLRNDDADPSELHDVCHAAICRLVAIQKPAYIAAVEQYRAGGAA